MKAAVWTDLSLHGFQFIILKKATTGICCEAQVESQALMIVMFVSDWVQHSWVSPSQLYLAPEGGHP